MTESLKLSLDIKYLADVPELIPTLAQLVIDAWGKYDPTLTLESQIKNLAGKLNKDKLPLVFVAFHKNILVATVGLKESIPVPGYGERNLWLGSFIVLNEYQSQGIGTQLLQHTLNKAKGLGYKKISLFTSNSENAAWYTAHGWKNFAKDTYQNHPVQLFEKII